MAQGQRRRLRADIPIAILGFALFVGYVWVLTRATTPVVTIFSFASDSRPKVYAAFLAIIAGLPGLLLTLPRALTTPPPRIASSVHQSRPLAERRHSYLRTDILAAVALLFAQVPLPAPWGPAGKAATIANVTKSAEIVELSAQFATYSVVVLAIGLLAAVLAKIYSHAAGFRVIAIILVVGAPVICWFLVVRAVS